jgi:ABC-type transport system involved in multi-copper enzyme maturation permease subunit
MLNIIKNEIRGRYKFLTGAFAVIVLANLYALYLSMWADKNMMPGGALISSLFIMPSIIIAIVYAVLAFSKDINTDTAYLMLTVPRSSQEIVGGKLIYSIIEYIILVGSSVGLLVLNLFIVLNKIPQFGINLPDFKIGAGSIIYVIFEFIFLFAWFVVLVYFSIILTKTILNSKKFRVPITFVVYFLINYLTSRIIDIVQMLLPFSIKLKPLILLNSRFDSSSFNINSGLNMNDTLMSVNISGLIVQLLMLGVMFYLTTYLMEKRLDV